MSTLYVSRDPQVALKLVGVVENDPDFLVLSTDEINLGVEEARNLKKWLAVKPLRQTKIAVITQAQKLTIEAQNALLKTLEEPPENTQLFLIAPDLEGLLPTVISRCQIVTLTSPHPPLSRQEKNDAVKILQLIDENAIPAGFSWAQKVPDRKAALAEIDKLLLASHANLKPQTVRKLFQAKKFLLANTNVRLTLENLFL